MQIHFVNHASIAVEHAGLKLLMDPWIEGRAFDDGWALLSPTAAGSPDFGDIQYLWFSHEHPDHFHPETLKNIPPAQRASITVLYQATANQRVAKFCRGLKFKDVIELDGSTWLDLPGGMKVLSGPYLHGDSWICVKTPGCTLLNLNDCLLETDDQLDQVKRQTGPVDVLLAQFSYANWIGNEEDRALRRNAAASVLEGLCRKARHFEARQVIPFASFVWFCHRENFYLNDEMNRIDRVHDALNQTAGATSVVLYPGDSWSPGVAHDSAASVARYLNDYERVRSAASLIQPRPVSLPDVIERGNRFIERIRAANRTLFIYENPVTYVWLGDERQSLKISLWDGVKPVRRARERCDVALTKDALAYVFRYLWGGETLFVNGRFRAPAGGHLQNFRALSELALMNNRDQVYPDLRQRLRRIGGKMLRSAGWR